MCPITAIAMVLLLGFAACSNPSGSKTTTTTTTQSTVYVAGNYNNGTKNSPCYWAGGTEHDLSLPSGWATGGATTSIIVQ
jgi:hypothetical protein